MAKARQFDIIFTKKSLKTGHFDLFFVLEHKLTKLNEAFNIIVKPFIKTQKMNLNNMTIKSQEAIQQAQQHLQKQVVEQLQWIM